MSTQDLLAIQLAVLGQDNARLPQLARPVITMQGGVLRRTIQIFLPWCNTCTGVDFLTLVLVGGLELRLQRWVFVLLSDLAK